MVRGPARALRSRRQGGPVLRRLPMSTIGELISKLKSRPGMYLGERSIDNLRSFLEGWMIARSPDRGDSEFMMGFQKWIQNRYKIHTSQSWANIIAFYAPDRVAALDAALDLLTEYARAHQEGKGGDDRRRATAGSPARRNADEGRGERMWLTSPDRRGRGDGTPGGRVGRRRGRAEDRRASPGGFQLARSLGLPGKCRAGLRRRGSQRGFGNLGGLRSRICLFL